MHLGLYFLVIVENKTLNIIHVLIYGKTTNVLRTILSRNILKKYTEYHVL